MSTGQSVVSRAITTLGINDPSGIPSVSDSNLGLDCLNEMWAAWGIDEGLIYAVTHSRYSLSPATQFYTIGQRQDIGAQPNWVGQRPARIYAARFITVTGGGIATYSIADPGSGYAANDTGTILGGSGVTATYLVTAVTAAGAITAANITAGTGYQAGNGYGSLTGGVTPGVGVGSAWNILTVTATGQSRLPLDVVNAEQYYAHRDLSATAQTPDEIYPDFAPDVDGFMRIYFYPVPTVAVASVLELDTAVNFVIWTLEDNYNIPQGMADLINWGLAGRLITPFGSLVGPQNTQVILAEAKTAEARVREMNRINRGLKPGSELAPMVTEQTEVPAK